MKLRPLLVVVAVVALGAACDRATGEGEGDSVGEGEGDGGEGEGAEGEGEGESVALPVFAGDVVVARSLFWNDPVLLDDPSFVSLGRVVGAAAEDLGARSPGELFSSLLRSFATTTHSTRFGPAQLEQNLHATLGADSAGWNLDDAPFRITGVHVRLDLAGVDDVGIAHCGELRVSAASTDAVLRPFHLLFLFRIPRDPVVAGVDNPTGCGVVARRFASLSLADNDGFHSGARELLDELLPNFLLIESVEFMVAPWEWRQWVRVANDGANDDVDALPLVFQNPPLFQQVDAARADSDEAFRADLSAFVDDNADAFDARTLKLPARFRPLSIRVNAGVPWRPLALELRDDVVAAHPSLRQHVEIVGCAACHTADADFVQTREDRTVSHFYDLELKARRDWLQATVTNASPPQPPFGPLQADPRLPP